MVSKNEKEECPAHKCKPFMLMSYVAAVFLILGICAFAKYLFLKIKSVTLLPRYVNGI